MRRLLLAITLMLIVLGYSLPSTAQAQLMQNKASGQRTSASKGSLTKYFGAMDDAAPMNLIAQSGISVVKKTVWLTPTNWRLNQLDPGYQSQLSQEMAEATALNVKVIFEIWPRAKGTVAVPLSPSQQRGVCDVAVNLATTYPQQTLGIEMGVEPNSPTFWQPQFGPAGTNVSAAAYESWLATCYVRIKTAAPGVMVIGGSLASHGNDNPSQGVNRASTSPVVFIQKMCEAYKASGDTQPLMDWFDMHSYEDSSAQPPSTTHPDPSTTVTIGDYAKLESLLGCFSGSAQPIPPVLWGESGYQSQITAVQMKQFHYRGVSSATATSVDEKTRMSYIAMEINMAYCQANSVGFINFLLVDQSDMNGWHSGLYYFDQKLGRPGNVPVAKPSLAVVRAALQSAQAGTAQCG